MILLGMAKPALNVEAFSPFVLKPLTLGLLEENARLASENASLREEIARLKGLKGKPDIKPPSKPSGMDKATEKRSRREETRRRGPKTPSAPVEERVIAVPDIPPGSRFKGCEDFTVQDLKIEPQVVCYRRERWLTPDGRTVLAPLPVGIADHFGPEITRSDQGRDCRDAFLGLAKTCRKLGISFWDFLGDRLGAAVGNAVPGLPSLIAARYAA
ncbi:MAG: hypothetical protein HQL42_14870 [Alphaproteobacteria bacterium]|nr:hypothetical protein [Alphaproteobacteria bacterium]